MERATRGSRPRLRSFWRVFVWLNLTHSPTQSNHTGLLCGSPPGPMVATCATAVLSSRARTRSGMVSLRCLIAPAPFSSRRVSDRGREIRHYGSCAALLLALQAPRECNSRVPRLALDLPGGIERRQQGLEVVGSVVANTVGEEGRGPTHPASQAAPQVFTHPARVGVLLHLPPEPPDVEPDLLRVGSEVRVLEPPARVEEPVVHLPELSLGRGGFGGLGGGLGVGVDAGEREDTEDEAQTVAETLPQPPYYSVRPHGVGAVVVAVLHEGQRRVGRSAHAVPITNRRVQLDGSGSNHLGISFPRLGKDRSCAALAVRASPELAVFPRATGIDSALLEAADRFSGRPRQLPAAHKGLRGLQVWREEAVLFLERYLAPHPPEDGAGGGPGCQGGAELQGLGRAEGLDGQDAGHVLDHPPELASGAPS